MIDDRHISMYIGRTPLNTLVYHPNPLPRDCPTYARGDVSRLLLEDHVGNSKGRLGILDGPPKKERGGGRAGMLVEVMP